MKRSACRAFTLIEVLLALGLFVVATGILAGSLYSGLQAYRAAASDTLTENRYRLVLREVLQISDRTEFERGGLLRLPDDTRAHWEVQLGDNPVLLDLLEAQITVRLEGDLPVGGGVVREPERERSFLLQLYRPDWMDVTDRAQLLDDRRRALEERRGTR